MKNAKDYAEEINKIYIEVTERLKELTGIISKSDKALQDVLHKIESSKFNVVEGYKFAKMIKEIRIERRMYKNDYETFGMLANYLYDNGFSKIKRKIDSKLVDQENRIYTPRVINFEQESLGQNGKES